MFTQTGAMKLAFGLLRCRLSYAKIVQARAMKACFRIAECRLSYAKINIIFNISNRFGTKIDTKLLLVQ